MRNSIFALALTSLMCVSCSLTRIVTVSPDVMGHGTYSTSVIVPRSHTTTTSTRVYAADNDISLHLDLQAVGAAFAQANTVEEFERLLNNSSYIISNLDLNNDGYVDYLRVLETVEGRNHVFLIQAVLADNVYQDVASVVAEMSGITTAQVQIIGDPFIYGANYIIRPVFVTTPAIYAHLMRAAYKPWRSPWYWGYYPSYYRRPAPVYLTHYQAYISTYMRNHRYCHEIVFETRIRFSGFDRLVTPMRRNDFGLQHPERAFNVRTANLPRPQMGNGQPMPAPVNARDIRERQNASTIVRTTPNTRGNAGIDGSRNSTGVGAGQRGTAGTGAGQYGNVPSTRGVGTDNRNTGTVQRGTNVNGQRTMPDRTPSSNQTTVKSRVATSGSSSTKTSTVTPSGNKTTVKRGNEPQRSASPQTRSQSPSQVRSGSSTQTRTQPSGQSGSRSTGGNSQGLPRR